MSDIYIPEIRTDWNPTEIVMPYHMNRIGEAINALRQHALELDQTAIVARLDEMKEQIAAIYTKGQVDDLLAPITKNITDILGEIEKILSDLTDKRAIADSYDKAQVDALLANKTNVSDSYTKAEIDQQMSKKVSKQDTGWIDLSDVTTSSHMTTKTSRYIREGMMIRYDYAGSVKTALGILTEGAVRIDLSGIGSLITGLAVTAWSDIRGTIRSAGGTMWVMSPNEEGSEVYLTPSAHITGTSVNQTIPVGTEVKLTFNLIDTSTGVSASPMMMLLE